MSSVDELAMKDFTDGFQNVTVDHISVQAMSVASEDDTDGPGVNGLDKFFLEVNNGLAVILNYVKFNKNHLWNSTSSWKITHGKQRKLEDRFGSDVDADRVYDTLSQFKVKFYQKNGITNRWYGLCNGTKNDTKRLISEIANDKDLLKTVDCLIVVVMSHGKDGQFATIDKSMDIEERLISPFQNDACEALRGKPKLFFIQACRGDQAGEGVPLPLESLSAANESLPPGKFFDDDIIEAKPIVTIPVESDVLVAYATVPGNVSIRNSSNGSWFLQDLCDVLQHFGHELDIQQVLSIVGNLVGDRTAKGKSVGGAKQCPLFVSRLRHIVTFVRQQSHKG